MHAVVDYDEVMNLEMSVGITALMLVVVKPPHAFHLVVCWGWRSYGLELFEPSCW